MAERFYRIRRKSDGKCYNKFGEWDMAEMAERWRDARAAERTVEWQLSDISAGVEIVEYEVKEVGVIGE